MRTGTAAGSNGVEAAMNRRTFLSGLVATPALAAILAACGDDSKSSGSAGTAGSDGTSAPTVKGIDHLTGADDVVMRLGSEGGFVPMGFAFSNVPTLLISGDGHVFAPGATTMEFPGALLPAITTRTITEEGIQRVLKLAGEAGLLAPPPDYTADVQVADVPDTVLVLNAKGGSFEHRANALGMAIDENGNPTKELTPAREKLAQFVQLISDLPKIAGAENVGAESVLQATEYRFQAMVTDQATIDGQDPKPGIVDWPADAKVRLADAGTCAKSSENSVTAVLVAAKQNTVFRDADALYTLSAVAVLPGDPVC